MSGGDDRLRVWRDALLGDDHGLAALAVAEGVVVRSNRAARAALPDARPGVHVAELFDPASRPKLGAMLGSANATATELQAARAEGPPLPIHLLALPGPGPQTVLLASAGPHDSAAAVATQLLAANDALVDLSRRLSRELNEAEATRRGMSELDDLRELFIAATAHDLRSPLAAILLSEELLRARAGSLDVAEVHRHGDRVTRNVHRLLELIDALLLSARIEAGEPGVPRVSMRLDDIAREAAEDLAPLAEHAGVRVEVASDGPAVVDGSPVWLREVLINLLSNAIRHAPSSTHVEVRIIPIDAMVRGEVIDRGPGIPTAERERVFQRYVQHGTHVGKSGLGLYLSRKVIEQHRGRIWIDDAPGGGARVVFGLPAADSPSPAAPP